MKASLQRQLAAVNQKRAPQGAAQQRKDGAVNPTLKLGATVDAPRVGYPCVYVQPDVLELFPQRACRVINASSGKDMGVFRALPAIIGQGFCSICNAPAEYERLSRLELIPWAPESVLQTVSLKAVFDEPCPTNGPAGTLERTWTPEELSRLLEELPHAPDYISQILTGGVLFDGQKLRTLLGGRFVWWTVSLRGDSLQQGAVSPGTLCSLSVQQSPSNSEQIEANLAPDLSGFPRSLLKLWASITEEEEMPAPRILHGPPGQGKSHFFFRLRQAGLQVIEPRNPADAARILARNAALPPDKTTIIFIDEADRFQGAELRRLAEVAAMRAPRTAVVFATNRLDALTSIQAERVLVAQDSQGRLSQLMAWLSREYPIGSQPSSEDVPETFLSILEQFSTADIAQGLASFRGQHCTLPTSPWQELEAHFRKRHPTGLRGFGVASKASLVCVGRERELEKLAHLTAIISNPKDKKMLHKNPSALLFGPPGSGKGALLRALGQKTGRSALALQASEVLSPYVGQSEQKLMEAARRAIQTSGVLFLDEIDAAFGTSETPGQRRLDGALQRIFDAKNLLLIAATNRPWALSRAVLRRFGAVMYVGPLAADEVAGFVLGDAGLKKFLPDDENERAQIEQSIIEAGPRTGAEAAALLMGLKKEVLASQGALLSVASAARVLNQNLPAAEDQRFLAWAQSEGVVQ